MKNQLLIVALLLIVSSFQCAKENKVNSNTETGQRAVLPASQQGKWELRESRSDMGLINHQPGNGDILNFAGSKYEVFNKNILLKSGAYSIEADATVEQHLCLVNLKEIYKHRIVFDNERKYNEYYSQGSDTLKPPTVVVQEYGKIFIGFSKNSDTLMLASGCFASDGGSISKYVKTR